MSNSTALAISIGILAIVISLGTINYSIQQQTDAINQANPSYVSESIQSSISQSIADSIYSASQSEYCSTISSQVISQNTTAIIDSEFTGTCPGGFPFTDLLIIVCVIGIVSLIIGKLSYLSD